MIDTVITKTNEAWQEATTGWKDDIARAFQTKVFYSLQQDLAQIKVCCKELLEASDTANESITRLEDAFAGSRQDAN
ncbi:MAG TPA: hypothetical protein VHV83_09800 [Armatimonadota bacterium]|nr:hypothetical protein [Armatimonadota bacterium]